MSIRDYEWMEFHYVDEDVDFALEGPPPIVVEAADGLPDELTDEAVVYVDDGEDHVHVFNASMRRNPDGTWQWQ